MVSKFNFFFGRCIFFYLYFNFCVVYLKSLFITARRNAACMKQKRNKRKNLYKTKKKKVEEEDEVEGEEDGEGGVEQEEIMKIEC